MALMGINLVPGMQETIPAQWRGLTILAGFILTVVGPVILGLVSRDNDKSSEQVGVAKQEPTKEDPKA